MGMTLTQKILAAHAGLAEVKAGQLINAKLDIVLGNDITTPVAINEFERAGFNSVFDKQHIAIVLDHFVPNKDIKSATQSKQCRVAANLLEQTPECVDRNIDVSRALSILRPEERTAITLFFVEDLAVAKIAEIMSISEGTVKSHLFRAKQKLGEYLKKNGYE